MINGTINNSSKRTICAKVECYSGTTTLVDTFYWNTNLIEFKVERLGENKLFGYGICQKATVKISQVEKSNYILTTNMRL